MMKLILLLFFQKPEEGVKVSGILVKRNFNYHILSPNDLSKYTDLTMSTGIDQSELSICILNLTINQSQ